MFITSPAGGMELFWKVLKAAGDGWYIHLLDIEINYLGAGSIAGVGVT